MCFVRSFFFTMFFDRMYFWQCILSIRCYFLHPTLSFMMIHRGFMLKVFCPPEMLSDWKIFCPNVILPKGIWPSWENCDVFWFEGIFSYMMFQLNSYLQNGCCPNVFCPNVFFPQGIMSRDFVRMYFCIRDFRFLPIFLH